MNNFKDIKNFSSIYNKASKLREVSVITKQYSQKITLAFGPLIQDELNNILFDLRDFYTKPLLGHNHPLQLKFDPSLNETIKKEQTEFYLMENQILSKGFPLPYKNSIYHIDLNKKIDFNQAVKRFIQVAWIEGKRVSHVMNQIENKLTNGLTLVNKNQIKIESNKINKEKCIEYGLYTDENNFKDDSCLLYIPIAISDFQLNDLLSRINKLAEEN